MPLNKIIFKNNLPNDPNFYGRSFTQSDSLSSITPPISSSNVELNIDDFQLTTPPQTRAIVTAPNLSKSQDSINYTGEKVDDVVYPSILLNYVEPFEISGVRKTAFFTEFSTNFEIGKRVFITNGNYDSPNVIATDRYAKGVEGYEILHIDGCKIVLDINFTGQKPYNEVNIDDVIFVHNIATQSSFDYINSFKTYVSNTTYDGLASYFAGDVVDGVFRSFTGNIITLPEIELFGNYFGFGDTINNYNFHEGVLSSTRSFWYKTVFDVGQVPSPLPGTIWSEMTQYFRTNSIKLLDEQSNPQQIFGNKKLFILGEDFEFDGTLFKERSVYVFDETTNKWKIDITYKRPIITKSLFIYGKFTGQHNSGVFGNYEKQNTWVNGTWKNGIILNTLWKNGTMESKSKEGERFLKSKLDESTDLLLSESKVSQSTDFTNNGGYGYNFIIDSVIQRGNFNKVTIENCNIGNNMTYSTVENYYLNEDIHDVRIDSAKLIFSDVNSSILNNTTIYDSIIRNSTINFSKSINNQIERSVFNHGEYNSDAGIKILGAELCSYDQNLSNFAEDRFNVGILRLYISDKDFFRMEKGDVFFIEKVNKEYFINALNNNYRINLPYECKFFLDTYFDYEFGIVGLNAESSPHQVSLRDKRNNRKKFNVVKAFDAVYSTLESPEFTSFWEEIFIADTKNADFGGLFDPLKNYDKGDFVYHYEYLGLESTEVAISRIWTRQDLGYETFEGIITGINFILFSFLVDTIIYGEQLYPSQSLSVTDSPDVYTFFEVTEEDYVGDNNNPISGGIQFDTDAIFELKDLTPGRWYYFNSNTQPEVLKWKFFLNPYPVPYTKGLNPDTDPKADIFFWQPYFDGTTAPPDEELYTTQYDALNLPSESSPLPGQFRGDFTTGLKNFPSISSKSIYCREDIVRFLDPSTEETRYFRALKDTRKSTESDPYFSVTQYLISGGAEKFIEKADSSYNNYCSIDIESRVFGWYIKFENETRTSLWAPGSKPPMASLLPLEPRLVDLVFKGTFIKNSNFESGLFVNSKWVSGSLTNNPNNIIDKFTSAFKNYFDRLWVNWDPTKQALKIKRFGGDAIYASNYGISDIKIGDIIWLDSVKFRDQTKIANQYSDVSGKYKVIEVVEDFGSYFSKEYFWVIPFDPITIQKVQQNLAQGNANYYSVPIVEFSMYISYHKFIMENSVINSGVLKRIYMKNSTVVPRQTFKKPSTYVIDPKITPLLINTLFVSNNLTIENAFIYQSHVTNINLIFGYIYSSYWNGPTFSAGEFESGAWINGSFLSGRFINSKSYDTVLADSYPFLFHNGVEPLRIQWRNGKFYSGEFFNSVWVEGNFYNGKFWKSDWYSGNWYNGILGDGALKVQDTTFGNKFQSLYFDPNPVTSTVSYWYDGDVQNALIGGHGDVRWYGGKMNSGEFTAYRKSLPSYIPSSIWYDGKFAGSIFSGLARWKNGTFEGGKFISHYGSTASSPTQSSDSPGDYAWENGKFLGGEFGTGDYITNSTWFNGQFEDGIFSGRFWKNGIVTGGKFYGSGIDLRTASYVDNTNENEYAQGFSSKYFGLWNDGYVVERVSDVDNTEKIESIVKRAVNIRRSKQPPYFQKILWLNGTFSHGQGTIKDSLFLNGYFDKGNFDGGVFNPYVDRSFVGSPTGSFGTFSAYWNSGTFITGSFYASYWKNGLWLDGYMSGAMWENGVWEYGRADNIFWNGGVWKNGTWNGSPFDFRVVATFGGSYSVKRGREKDIILTTNRFITDYTYNDVRTARFSGTIDDFTDYPASHQNTKTYIHLNNIFAASESNVILQRLTGSSVFAANPNGWTWSETFFTTRVKVNNVIGDDSGVSWRTVIRSNGSWTHSSTVTLLAEPERKTPPVVAPANGISDKIDPPLTEEYDNQAPLFQSSNLTNVLLPISQVPQNKQMYPYVGGYNNYWKPDNYSLDDVIASLGGGDVNLVGVINPFDSNPSPKLYVRRGGVHPSNPGTDIFTQSNVAYVIEFDISVELQKTVTVEVGIGGLSYSTFNLDSSVFLYQPLTKADIADLGRSATINYPLRYIWEDYYPKFYRIRLYYYTSADLTGLVDGRKIWIRKASRGLLRIYRFRLTGQNVSYHQQFNNTLYDGIDWYRTRNIDSNGNETFLQFPKEGQIYLPATPSVAINTVSKQGYEIGVNFGNGIFRQGVWETGIWNNGLRASSVEFGIQNSDDLLRCTTFTAKFTNLKYTSWLLSFTVIESLFDYPFKLKVGTQIAISNLAGYDFAGKRIVLQNTFVVTDINLDSNKIAVFYVSKTPLSTISKDSDQHLIYLSVNIWKNGAFLNGKFSGIFNNGLLTGYPSTTVAEDTHLISGRIDGGRFSSVDTLVDDGIYPRYKTSLVQQAFIKDNNIASVNNKIYRTWMDLNYFTYSKSHLKTNKTVFRRTTTSFLNNTAGHVTSVATSRLGATAGTFYNPSNLSGFVTPDVLSSTVLFRDFASSTIKRYRLGTKRTIYRNLVSDNGNFLKSFSNDPYLRTISGISTFGFLGLTATVVFQRASGILFSPSNGSGTILSVSSNTDASNDDVLSLFLTHSSTTATNFVVEYGLLLKRTDILPTPDRYYELSVDLDYRRLLSPTPSSFTESLYLDDVVPFVPSNGYLPNNISSNLDYVNHLSTSNSKKVEYFYNKSNFDIYFQSVGPRFGGPIDIRLRNTSFYEVDMIPFFQYFTASEIDRSINTPLSGKSPKYIYDSGGSIVALFSGNSNFIDNFNLSVDPKLIRAQNIFSTNIDTSIGAQTPNFDPKQPNYDVISPKPPPLE